jgi:hypothetical protein
MRDAIRQFVTLLLVTLLCSPLPLGAQSYARPDLAAGQGKTSIEGAEVPLSNRPDTTVYPVPPAVQDLNYAVTPTDIYLTWTDILPKHFYSPDAAFVVSRKEVGKDADFVQITLQPIVRINSPSEQPVAWPARLGNFHDAFQTTLPVRLQQMITAPVPPATIRSLEKSHSASASKPLAATPATPQFRVMQVPSAPTAAQSAQSQMSQQVLTTPAQTSAARTMVASPGAFTYERFQNVLDRRADRGMLLATFHPPSAILRGVGFFDTTVEAGKHYLYRVEMITGTPNQGVYQQNGKLAFYPAGTEFIPASATPVPPGTRFPIGQTSKEIVAGQITAPPAPTNLKVEEGRECIYLSWDIVPNSEGYTVSRAEAGSSSFVLLTSQPIVPAAQLAQGRLGIYSPTAARAALLEQAMNTSPAQTAGPSKLTPATPLVTKGAPVNTARMATMGLPSSVASSAITAPRAESMATAKMPQQLKTQADRVQLALAQHLLLPSYYYVDTPPDLRKSYIYKVASRDLLGQGNESSPSDPHHAHHVPLPPSRVRNVTQPTDRGVVRLAWDAVSDPLVQSLNVRVAEATLENPGASSVVATLPPSAAQYDFTTKQVRHPFQFFVTAVGVTRDSTHDDESNPSERITAAARKLELPAPPVDITVTPLQSADQLNNDPNLKIVDVVISWRVKESDTDLAGFRILKSSTPGNPDGLKLFDQHFLAATNFVQANASLFTRSVAQQVIVSPSLAASAVQQPSAISKGGAKVIAPSAGGLRSAQMVTVPQAAQSAVQTGQMSTQAAVPSVPVPAGVKVRSVQPFNLRPEVMAAPRAEMAKGVAALIAREMPREQTIGTVLVDEFAAQSSGVMRFNPATRAALTGKFGFKTAVSPMLYFKNVGGVGAATLQKPLAAAPQRFSTTPITAAAPKTLAVSGISSGQNASANSTQTVSGIGSSQSASATSTQTVSGVSSSQSSSATSPQAASGIGSNQSAAATPAMQQLSPGAAKVSAVAAREAISPSLFKKLTTVSIANRYEFVDHIPISSRNVQYYRIASYDQGYVESSFSGKVRFTLASYIKPYPPRLIHLELTDDRQVKLTFAGIPETDFAGFNVYRTDTRNPSAPREKLNSSPLSFNTETFVDETPLTGKRSFYLVTTVNTEGLESDPSDLIAVVVPAAPESLSAQNLQASWNATAGGVQLDWQPPVAVGGAARTDIIGYVVFRDPGPEGVPAKSSETAWGVAIGPLLTATQFVDTSLTAAGTYTYRVVAFTADEGGLPPAVVAVNVSATP